jgi:hypothetical protein
MKLEGIEKKIECLKSGIPQYNAAFALRAWGELVPLYDFLEKLHAGKAITCPEFLKVQDTLMQIERPISRIAMGFLPNAWCNPEILPPVVSNIKQSGFSRHFSSVCYSFYVRETAANGNILDCRIMTLEWDKIGRGPWKGYNLCCQTKAETKTQSLKMAQSKYDHAIITGIPGGVPRSKFMEVSK